MTVEASSSSTSLNTTCVCGADSSGRPLPLKGERAWWKPEECIWATCRGEIDSCRCGTTSSCPSATSLSCGKGDKPTSPSSSSYSSSSATSDGGVSIDLGSLDDVKPNSATSEAIRARTRLSLLSLAYSSCEAILPSLWKGSARPSSRSTSCPPLLSPLSD